MDKYKLLEPKFSLSLEPLYSYLKENYDGALSDAGSTVTSDYSLFRGQNLLAINPKGELPKINESVSPKES